MTTWSRGVKPRLMHANPESPALSRDAGQNESSDSGRRRTSRLALRSLFALVAFVVLGNLVMVGATTWARRTSGPVAVPEGSVPGIDNLRVVDQRVWRGAAPSAAGYRALAAAGTDTVVDLRAGDGSEIDDRLVVDLGMRLVRIPVPDGQIPSPAAVDVFTQAVAQARGKVFVHCGAGVGRTGAMVGAYLVSQRTITASAALRANLAVGPPSLEQVVFVAGLGQGQGTERPAPAVIALSRLLDGPRRIWHRLEL